MYALYRTSHAADIAWEVWPNSKETKISVFLVDMMQFQTMGAAAIIVTFSCLSIFIGNNVSPSVPKS